MEWMAVGGGVDWSLADFLGANLFGLGVLWLAVWASRKWAAWRWPLISASTIFVANGVWHAAICLMAGSYIPGVLTGVLIYIPLGCVVIVRLWRMMPRSSIIFGMIAGMLIHGAVIWLALRMPGFTMEG